MNPENHSFSFGAQGTHRAWIEGEDVVHIAWRGNVSAVDVTAGARAFELVARRERGFFLVLHVAEQRQFTAEARRAISADPRSSWVRDIIVVGGTFHFRVLIEMVSKAMSALGLGKATMKFVDTEDDVPEQIERLRCKWKDKL